MKFIKTLRNYHPPKGETVLEEFLLEQYRRDLLELRAAGRLVISGELAEIAPAEDGRLMDEANPLEVGFDSPQNEKREDAIVRNVLAGAPVAVVIVM